jgi:hypothetical protein
MDWTLKMTEKHSMVELLQMLGRPWLKRQVFADPELPPGEPHGLHQRVFHARQMARWALQRTEEVQSKAGDANQRSTQMLPNITGGL